MIGSYNEEFMRLAAAEAKTGIENGHGGPFGAVIAKDGKVIAAGHNRVIKDNDSTCHGEIAAIRKAEQALASFDLSGCELYTTAEPCPMCLAAILWANISKVYYGCSTEDSDSIGFRDARFQELLKEDRSALGDMLEQKGREICLEVFEEYKSLDKTIY